MSRIHWSEAARALFSLSAPTAVSAGAGSGKTTCLVELCVRLLSGEATGAPCEPGALVAITFTEKAAVELEERLREAVSARTARAAPGSEEARAWSLRLHGLDGMAIGTIHGFARRLLRDHPFETGIDPDARVLEEQEADARRRDAARAALLAAIDDGRAEARRLAGAHGVGGRRSGLADAIAAVMRERSSLGDREPLRPGPDATAEALALRSELRRSVDALLAAAPGVLTATGKRAMERLRDARGAGSGEGPVPSLRPSDLTGAAEIGAILRGWRAGKSDGGGARELKAELAALCERFVPVAAEALALPQAREICALVADAEERYRRGKWRDGVLDFDDLLLGVCDLLRAPGPRDELRRRYRAILVDEYQDVNRVQQEIFELLTGGEDGGAGAATSPSRPLLVAVGDLKQSIYRFRGADVSVFRGVVDRFARSALGPDGGRVLHLVENHRSSPAVVALVNAVFSRCMQPPPEGSREYELAFGASDHLVARRAPGQLPCCELLVDEGPAPAAERRAREGRALAERIRALVSGAAGVEVRDRSADGDPELPRRPSFRDVAILFRRLTHTARRSGARCGA